MKRLLEKSFAVLLAVMLIVALIPTFAYAAPYSKTLYNGDGFTLSLSKGLDALDPQNVTFNVYVDGTQVVNSLVVNDVPRVGTNINLTKGYSYTAECSGTSFVLNDELTIVEANPTVTFRITTKKINDNITIKDGSTTYGTFSWNKAAATRCAYERNLKVYVNGKYAYTQKVYTPEILTNFQASPQFYFVPSTDKFNSNYELNPTSTLGTLANNRDLSVYLTTRCKCGLSTCLCEGGDCTCPVNCTCDKCTGAILGDNQINTGYGIISYKTPTAQGYNLTVEIYVNGEKQYTSSQLRIRGAEFNCLDFEPANGYFFANGVNYYDMKTKNSGSYWTRSTGFIYINGISSSSRNYDNRLIIYLCTSESNFRLNVERDAGDPIEKVKGYTASYVAFDPKTNSYHEWSHTITDFGVLSQPTLPKQTDITLTAICDEGYEVDTWYSSIESAKIREAEGDADNNRAKGNSIILRVTTATTTTIPLYITDIKDAAKYTLTYDVNGGIIGTGPNAVTDLHNQKGYTLATSPAPAHAKASGNDVVFIGWSKDVDAKIYSKNDADPTNIITTVDIEGNTTVHAVWGYDANSNNIADVYENLYSVTYDVNGGNANTCPSPETGLLAKNGYALATSPVPTHQRVGTTAVVFIGWSASADSKIYGKDDNKPTNLITTVNVNANKTVYAVWGYDVNNNGKPDVNETLYSLTYDVNGGNTGTAPNTATGLLTQTGYTLATSPVPTHADANSKSVVFIGWSASADSTIYGKDDTAPSNIIKTVNITGNTTVYAVWGYDANGNNTPDVTEDLYSLTYDVNGGNTGTAPNTATGLLAQSNYTLATSPIPTHANNNGYAVKFIGWSASADSRIYNKNDTVPSNIITTVNITGNTTVYAVWGYDVNNNNKPDVTEDLFNLTYNVNGGISSTGPATVTGLLTQNGYTLATTPVPTHINVNNTPVIFIGWSASADSTIYGKGDTNPSNIITTVNITADTTVYAVWGYDANGNNIPDVNEILYSLTYDVNGGNAGTAPNTETGLLTQNGYALATSPVPAHDDASGTAVKFIGWSATADSTIYGKGETLAYSLLTSVNITGNTTVYAVWGYDTNGNGTPDVEEDLYNLIYNVNGGIAGTGPTTEIGLLAQNGYTLATSPKPKHNKENDIAVIFLGWSKIADSTIYGKDNADPSNIITTVDITDHTRVYAVWGYDANENGKPDVYEELFTITYNANGGNADSVPAQAANLLEQSTYKLTTNPAPTHDDVDGCKVIFISWSLNADDTIYAGGDEKPTDLIKTVKVNGNAYAYAVWGLDANGNGIPDVYEEQHEVPETGDSYISFVWLAVLLVSLASVIALVYNKKRFGNNA